MVRCSATTLKGTQCRLKARYGLYCSRHQEQSHGDICVICFDRLYKTNIVTLGCQHRYHIKCIKRTFRKYKCPLCNRRFRHDTVSEDTKKFINRNKHKYYGF